MESGIPGGTRLPSYDADYADSTERTSWQRTEASKPDCNECCLALLNPTLSAALSSFMSMFPEPSRSTRWNHSVTSNRVCVGGMGGRGPWGLKQGQTGDRITPVAACAGLGNDTYPLPEPGCRG